MVTIRYGSPSPANRLVKHFLQKWYYLDNNIEYLNEVERVNMKILYSGLKELTAEELELLAVKYRVEKKPYVTDAVVAEKLGILFKDYREKRIIIEDKLRPHIVKNRDLYKSDLSKSITSNYGNKRKGITSHD